MACLQHIRLQTHSVLIPRLTLGCIALLMQEAAARAIFDEQMHPMRRVAKLTESYSGSELQTIVKECIVLCWQRREKAMRQCCPSDEIARAAEVQEADVIRSVVKVRARLLCQAVLPETFSHIAFAACLPGRVLSTGRLDAIVHLLICQRVCLDEHYAIMAVCHPAQMRTQM